MERNSAIFTPLLSGTISVTDLELTFNIDMKALNQIQRLQQKVVQAVIRPILIRLMGEAMR